EAHARGRVHRLRHVANELLHLGRHDGDRRGGLAESRVGIFEDRKERHSGNFAAILQNVDSACRIQPKPLFCVGLGRWFRTPAYRAPTGRGFMRQKFSTPTPLVAAAAAVLVLYAAFVFADELALAPSVP